MNEEEKELLAQYQDFKTLMDQPSWETYVSFVQSMVSAQRAHRSDVPIEDMKDAFRAEYSRGFANGLAAAIVIPESVVGDLSETAERLMSNFEDVNDDD